MLRFGTFLEAIFGCMSILLAANMAQGAFYALSRETGDAAFPFLAIILTGFAVHCGLHFQNAVLPSIVAMAMAFGQVSVLAAFAWKTRQMFFDLSSPFQFGLSHASVVLLVLMPAMIIAAIVPFVIRFFWPQTGAETLV